MIVTASTAVAVTVDKKTAIAAGRSCPLRHGGQGHCESRSGITQRNSRRALPVAGKGRSPPAGGFPSRMV